MVDVSDYVRPELFGKDHWSTLAYAETVMVECGGFQIGFDVRMRQNRRNYRVMREMCRKPKRARQGPDCGCMWEPKYSTVLADKSVVEGHDDWSCIQDCAEAGFFTVGEQIARADRVEPGVILHLSPLGRATVEGIRAHKAAGGNFGNFRFKGTPEFQYDPAAMFPFASQQRMTD
jgi:hypothetical protein